MSECAPESADRRIAEAKRAAEKYLRIAQEMAQREAEQEAEKKRAEAEAKKAAAIAEKKAERAARKRAAEVEATQAETETESGAGGGTCYRCWQNGIPCVRPSDPGRQKACTPCAVAKAKCAMPTAEELARGRPKEGVKTSSKPRPRPVPKPEVVAGASGTQSEPVEKGRRMRAGPQYGVREIVTDGAELVAVGRELVGALTGVREQLALMRRAVETGFEATSRRFEVLAEELRVRGRSGTRRTRSTRVRRKRRRGVRRKKMSRGRWSPPQRRVVRRRRALRRKVRRKPWTSMRRASRSSSRRRNRW